MAAYWVPMLLCISALLCGISHATYQEMTHVMDVETMMISPFFFDEKYHFFYRIDQNGTFPPGDFVAWNSYGTVEHMGTHFDSPYHAWPSGRQTHEISLEELHGPLVRIDIAARAAEDPLAMVQVEDLESWEEQYGPIPDNAYVLMDSGWHERWGDQVAFVGVEVGDPNPENWAWPAWSEDAVQWLLDNRNIRGVGTDTVSCDNPFSDRVHAALFPQDKFCFENLDNVDKVPDTGAEFFFHPLFLKGGTGGQGRAYAFWDTELYTADGATMVHANIVLMVILVVHLVF